MARTDDVRDADLIARLGDSDARELFRELLEGSGAGTSVGILGGGPAGVASALGLAQVGYDVTLLEAPTPSPDRCRRASSNRGSSPTWGHADTHLDAGDAALLQDA